MKLSKSELMVMEILWDPNNLDENGEILAAEVSRLLAEKHGWVKTSNYTFFGRLLEKGAISRRYPKYTMKPLVKREEFEKSQSKEFLDTVFHGSVAKMLETVLGENKVSKKELDELQKILDSYRKK